MATAAEWHWWRRHSHGDMAGQITDRVVGWLFGWLADAALVDVVADVGGNPSKVIQA